MFNRIASYLMRKALGWTGSIPMLNLSSTGHTVIHTRTPARQVISLYNLYRNEMRESPCYSNLKQILDTDFNLTCSFSDITTRTYTDASSIPPEVSYSTTIKKLATSDTHVIIRKHTSNETYTHKKLPVIVYVQQGQTVIDYDISSTKYVMDMLQNVFSDITEYIPVINKDSNKVMFLTESISGLYFKVVDINTTSEHKYKKKDYKYNYGDDLLETYRNIRSNIVEGKSGLYLMHGPPGCGKTALIYRLIDEISNRLAVYNVVYVTPEMTSRIGSPLFTELLMSIREDAKGPIVLIMEDTGEFITHQDNRHPATVALLNITDGIVGAAMGDGISVIITYNNDDNIKLDEAIVRRCVYDMYVGPLTIEQSDNWCEVHNIPPLGESMTISQLYKYLNSSAPSRDRLDTTLEDSQA